MIELSANRQKNFGLIIEIVKSEWTTKNKTFQCNSSAKIYTVCGHILTLAAQQHSLKCS